MFYASSIYSKTSFPGVDTFSSTVHLSMGGAGYLKSSPSNKPQKIATTGIKYVVDTEKTGDDIASNFI